MSDYDCVVGDVGKIYITADTDKPVKLVFSGDLSNVHCGNGVYIIHRKKEKLNIDTSWTLLRGGSVFLIGKEGRAHRGLERK